MAEQSECTNAKNYITVKNLGVFAMAPTSNQLTNLGVFGMASTSNQLKNLGVFGMASTSNQLKKALDDRYLVATLVVRTRAAVKASSGRVRNAQVRGWPCSLVSPTAPCEPTWPKFSHWLLPSARWSLAKTGSPIAFCSKRVH